MARMKYADGALRIISTSRKDEAPDPSVLKKMEDLVKRRCERPLGAAAGGLLVVRGPVDFLWFRATHLQLMIQRSGKTMWPLSLMWGAAGRVEGGEDPRDALLREMGEELLGGKDITPYVEDVIPRPELPFDLTPRFLGMDGYPFIVVANRHLVELILDEHDEGEVINPLWYDPVLRPEGQIRYLASLVRKYGVQPHFEYFLRRDHQVISETLRKL